VAYDRAATPFGVGVLPRIVSQRRPQRSTLGFGPLPRWGRRLVARRSTVDLEFLDSLGKYPPLRPEARAWRGQEFAGDTTTTSIKRQRRFGPKPMVSRCNRYDCHLQPKSRYQSQRDCGPKPRVAPPGSHPGSNQQPSAPNGVAAYRPTGAAHLLNKDHASHRPAPVTAAKFDSHDFSFAGSSSIQASGGGPSGNLPSRNSDSAHAVARRIINRSDRAMTSKHIPAIDPHPTASVHPSCIPPPRNRQHPEYQLFLHTPRARFQTLPPAPMLFFAKRTRSFGVHK
jgi:hypothetical protein